jgi:hypothetical protein
MKPAIDKQPRIIVNICGGRCPDLPRPAGELAGHLPDAAPVFLETGHETT